MKKNQVILISISALAFILSAYLFWSGLSKEFLPLAEEQKKVLGEKNIVPAGFEQAKVAKVIDGDTIEIDLSGEVKKIRYIGVDTPETVDPRRPVGCFGKQASDENKRLVEGRSVWLEKDVSDTDKFGRLLRYVYIDVDSKLLFLNDYLVRNGFARTATFPPDVKYSQRFLEAEKEAREEKRGLWSKC